MIVNTKFQVIRRATPRLAVCSIYTLFFSNFHRIFSDPSKYISRKNPFYVPLLWNNCHVHFKTSGIIQLTATHAEKHLPILTICQPILDLVQLKI